MPAGTVLTTVRKRPCQSCPYRRDVPSGIWEESEYDKLPRFDGDVPDQLAAGATGLFFCHQRTGDLCAGWAGCHDMDNSLAVRLNAATLNLDTVLGYVSPVPLFRSGAEAAAHGKRDIAAPGAAARRMMAKLQAIKARREMTAAKAGGEQA